LKKSHLIIVLIAGLATVIFYETVILIINNGYRGAPLDDTYIHLKFADNFSKGYFFHYNPGEPTAGSTSPLWVILIGLSGFLNKGLLFNAIFFSWLFYILSAIIIYKIIFHITEKSNNLIALYFSLLFLFTGRVAYISSSGMETSLFIFLILTVIYIDFLNKESLFYIKWALCGLLVTTRPEGFVLAFLLFLKDTYNLLFNKKSSHFFLKLSLGLLIFLILSSPYIIFSLYTNGSPFPNTFKGVNKLYTENQYLDFIKKSTLFFLRDNFLIFLSSIAGIFFLTINSFKEKIFYPVLIPIFYFLTHLGFSVFVFPNSRHYGRYFIPDYTLLIIIGAYFIHYFFSKKNFLPKTQKLILLILLVFSFPYFIKIAYDNGNFVSNINSMHIEAVKWINSNISKNSVIGLNDIGAVGYYTENYIIDLEGLITPEILRYKGLEQFSKNDSILSFILKKNADYIIIFDNWYPGLSNLHKNYFHFIHTIFVENNLTLGDNNLNFYKIFRDK
jgi:hypothetical protein